MSFHMWLSRSGLKKMSVYVKKKAAVSYVTENVALHVTQDCGRFTSKRDLVLHAVSPVLSAWLGPTNLILHVEEMPISACRSIHESDVVSHAFEWGAIVHLKCCRFSCVTLKKCRFTRGRVVVTNVEELSFYTWKSCRFTRERVVVSHLEELSLCMKELSFYTWKRRGFTHESHFTREPRWIFPPLHFHFDRFN